MNREETNPDPGKPAKGSDSSIARGYDEIAERIGMSEEFYTALLRFSGEPKTPLLDVGCGGGHLLERLEKGHGLSSDCHGIDISPRLCELCRERTRAEVKVGDATKLPFPDLHFRTIFSTEVLEHILEPEEMFREMRRVLTDDGRCILTIPNRDWPRYERYNRKRVQYQPVDDRFYRLAEIRELASKTGFTVRSAGGFGSIWHGGFLGKLELLWAALIPALKARRKRLFVSLVKNPANPAPEQAP